jgi:hypothetical protein
MKKKTKTYLELNEIQKLKISKVFMHERLDISKKNDCKIVFEGVKMKYLFVDENIIDL